MDAWLQEELFDGFGHDALLPYPPRSLGRVNATDTKALRDHVRLNAPRLPGVYGMIDIAGRLIYVGKSKLLRNRLLSYFLPNSEDEKAGRIIQSAQTIVWETQPSEFAALLREQWLIRTYQPKYNVQGIPNRQKSVFLCLGRGPAETFYVSRELDPKAVAWDGPLVGAGRVRRAAEILNRYFQLRDCSNQTRFRFTDQMRLFDLEVRAGCVRHEIESCLGPCVQACSRKNYLHQVNNAANFLKGESTTMISELESQMLTAAKRTHFEQAAKYREDLQVIRWLTNRLADHAHARDSFTCIYPVVGEDGRDVWYLIRRGVVEHAVAAPRDGNQFRSVRSEIHQWKNSDQTVGVKYVRREETLAIVSSWFRKNLHEKKRIRVIDDLPHKYKDWLDFENFSAKQSTMIS